MGTAIADRFGAEGAQVVGIDRAELTADFPVLTADLSNDDEARGVFARIAADYGPIDGLVVNAGTIAHGDTSLLSAPVEVWRQSFDAIVLPAVLSCRYAVPAMDADRGGSIVLVGSFLAGMGSATAQMAFNAAKAAVAQVGQDLGIHLARRNIRVNTVAIGPMDTPELRVMFDLIGPEQVERRMSRFPTGRPATLDELAATVAYLVSADSGYLTGAVLPLDGGISLAYTIPT
jgi:NAD(P)-dependent dehydrogenase (short-subunit alcohol dehydrogenase family)